MDAETVPENVRRFEALLYASLLIDTVSAALLMDRPSDADAGVTFSVVAFVLAFFLGLMHLIRLAARRRKDWARWTLIVLYLLSAASLLTNVKQTGLDLRNIIDFFSLALTAAGFHYSFNGDAVGWFGGPAAGRHGG